MEPILDEVSLVPCSFWPPSDRIRTLAKTLQTLDELGVAPVLRSVRDAARRDIGQERGLNYWCFERGTDRDAGRLVANRLGKQPFIDGDGGLFALAEGNRAVEGKVDGVVVFGLALAALNDEAAVLLGSADLPGAVLPATVTLSCLDEAGDHEESVSIPRLVTVNDVTSNRDWILERVDRGLTNGAALLQQAPHVFPRLRFGSRAIDPIARLVGTDQVFRQLVRHLRALEYGARNWLPGTQYAPGGALSWSCESKATLDHGRYGPMRDFPVPDGFTFARWSYHTKLTGRGGFRLYFRADRITGNPVVLIGYFGAHLPSVEYPK